MNGFLQVIIFAMKNKSKLFAFFLMLFVFFISSCKKENKNGISTEEEINVSSSLYDFYYFSDGTYRKTNKVSDSPVIPQKPWTEAVRISAISNSSEKAFAVVNRIGIMSFDNERIDIFPDAELFGGRTAGNLVFYEGNPVYSLYRSTFFNDMEFNNRGFHPFLVQFNYEQKISYPIVNVENLGLGNDTEITDYVWNGKTFICSAKNSEDSKVSFSYWKFQPKENLLSITPENASQNLLVMESNVNDFRNVQNILLFEDAPERIKDILKYVKSSEFLISVRTASGFSPRRYLKVLNNNEENSTLNAYAFLDDYWCGVLFQDGTFFIKGALPERHIFNNGKTIAIRLPKLPNGFSYSGFAISGGKLYASWEETDFYKTARSGFISVNIEKVVY